MTGKAKLVKRGSASGLAGQAAKPKLTSAPTEGMVKEIVQQVRQVKAGRPNLQSSARIEAKRILGLLS